MAWYNVCAETDIALGKHKDFKINHRHILVYHLASGWKASSVRCPHAGAIMTHCDTQGNEIECCFHGWRFDLDNGNCSFPPGGPKLDVYKVEVKKGLVFVHMD